MNFRKLVNEKIESIGTKEASKFFGVSIGTISNWHSGATSPSLDAVELCLSEVDAPIVEEPLTLWEGKNVIILQPVYRSINPDTHFTLFANYAKYGPEKIGIMQEKKTNVYEARNLLADKFLDKTTAHTIIMNDDDMIMPCGNASLFNDRYRAGVSAQSAGFNAISRIMSHPDEVGIVGALYFGRHVKGKAQCSMGFSDEKKNEDLHLGKMQGLVKDGWVGTGFMRVKRWVFEKMAEEIDNGRWPDLKPKAEAGWRGYFTPLAVGVGEDVSFCRRAGEIGIQTYLDASLVCLHVGDVPFGPNNTK